MKAVRRVARRVRQEKGNPVHKNTCGKNEQRDKNRPECNIHNGRVVCVCVCLFFAALPIPEF